MITDPRDGDAEDDRAAPMARSMAAIAGGLLAEISLIKVVAVLLLLVVLPNLILGLAPLLVGAWVASLSTGMQTATSFGSVLVLLAVFLVGRFIWRPVYRVIESNFWALNALLVQPFYVLCREVLRHVTDRFRNAPGLLARDRRGSWTAFGAGVCVALIGLLVIAGLWPQTRWTGFPADLLQPARLIRPALANAAVLVATYSTVVALVWGIADGTMDQPRDLKGFDLPVEGQRRWRIAHVSDVHVVGERFGFRLESGRTGPQGNAPFDQMLEQLAKIHLDQPLDILLFSGDMTDAGRATEWAEFLESLSRHPALQAIALLLPGNHDLNIIDRANPARLELPWNPIKALRRLRMIAAMDAIQGDRTLVVTGLHGTAQSSFRTSLVGQTQTLERFGKKAAVRDVPGVDRVWHASFPQILPPQAPEGLGVILLDSNAETHFSFTNALGMLSTRQALAIESVMTAYPSAGWIIAMHHHLVEYPKATDELSTRIGTALINGTWVARQLKRHGARIVVMHGHRHVDWIGRCGPVRIISAPSPVMNATARKPASFLIHSVQMVDGKLALLEPERVIVQPSKAR
jgi:3',5'-cyclic AMP phosphodiesterase CpdA